MRYNQCMKSDDVIQQVNAELQNRFRAAGHGSVARVQEALGLNGAYFRDLRRRERRHFDLRVLIDALEVLDVKPADFFVRVFGASNPIDTFCFEASLLARRGRQPTVLNIEPKPDGSSLDDEDLRRLDGERRENPGRVIRRVRGLIPNASGSQRLFLLGIHASACRVAGRLDEAHVVVAHALDMARDSEDKAMTAELLLRGSYILADRGEYTRAIELTEQASLIYLDIGDFVGLGKSQADRASVLGPMGRVSEAITVLEAALGHLPVDSERKDIQTYRAACLLNLARGHLQLGHLEETEDYALRARRAAVGTHLEAELAWMQASIAKQRGKLDAAEDFLSEVIELYRPVAPLNTALATLELTRLLLDRDKVRESYETAKTMTLVIGDLESNPLASAVVTEVLRIVLAGNGLTKSLLYSAIRHLRGEGNDSEAVPLPRTQ